jgi:VIT1/CCC1 family predicted Fe2+/Mn2+ transporter
MPGGRTLAVAAVLGGLVLLALGAMRGRLAGRPVGRTAAETVGVGFLAALAAWAIGVVGGAVLR